MNLQMLNDIRAMKEMADSINEKIETMNEERRSKCDDLDASDGEYYNHAKEVSLGRQIDKLDINIKEKKEELSKIKPILDSYKFEINDIQSKFYGKYYANNQILTYIEDEIQTIDIEMENTVYRYAELYYSFDENFDLENMDKFLVKKYTKDNSQEYNDLIDQKDNAENRYSAVEKVRDMAKYNIDKINAIEYEIFGKVTPQEKIITDIKSTAINALKEEIKKDPKNNYKDIENSLKISCDELSLKK